jgi:hypothetical protein
LIGKKVNVIFTTGTSATRAAMATTAWFFPYQQVDDSHMLAYSTTDGKGFSYPLMCRINICYAIAYLIALVAAILYWRYLGLMGLEVAHRFLCSRDAHRQID